jgi:SAM-dependent methyltransferase
VSDAFTDRKRLVGSAYATPKNFNARRSIYSYRVPPLDVVSFAEDLVNWRGDERLLDVGCGPGHYVTGIRAKHPGVRATLADLSPGMVAAAKDATGAPGIVSDVTALPFADGMFDVTLAMHMLYHVPDIPAAAGELRRVTSPTGVALVSTNSDQHVRELRALLLEAIASALGKPVGIPWPSADRFSVENGGEILSRAFKDVRRKAAWGMLSIPKTAPIVDYVRSIRTLIPNQISDNEELWGKIVSFVERRAGEVIAERGRFEVSTRGGVFVCR